LPDVLPLSRPSLLTWRSRFVAVTSALLPDSLRNVAAQLPLVSSFRMVEYRLWGGCDWRRNGGCCLMTDAQKVGKEVRRAKVTRHADKTRYRQTCALNYYIRAIVTSRLRLGYIRKSVYRGSLIGGVPTIMERFEDATLTYSYRREHVRQRRCSRGMLKPKKPLLNICLQHGITGSTQEGYARVVTLSIFLVFRDDDNP
jgi:hypothetical protein